MAIPPRRGIVVAFVSPTVIILPFCREVRERSTGGHFIEGLNRGRGFPFTRWEPVGIIRPRLLRIPKFDPPCPQSAVSDDRTGRVQHRPERGFHARLHGPGRLGWLLGQRRRSCAKESDSGCAMHCPKGSCCCGKPLPPVIPGMVYFKGFQCGPDDFGTGEVIFPQFFAWKFVPGNGHVGFAVPDYSREPIGQAQDFATDFRSAPPTPPPRSA